MVAQQEAKRPCGQPLSWGGPLRTLWQRQSRWTRSRRNEQPVEIRPSDSDSDAPSHCMAEARGAVKSELKAMLRQLHDQNAVSKASGSATTGDIRCHRRKARHHASHDDMRRRSGASGGDSAITVSKMCQPCKPAPGRRACVVRGADAVKLGLFAESCSGPAVQTMAVEVTSAGWCGV